MSPTSQCVNGGRLKQLNHHMKFLCSMKGADMPSYCIWVAVEMLLRQRNGKQLCVCVTVLHTRPQAPPVTPLAEFPSPRQYPLSSCCGSP